MKLGNYSDSHFNVYLLASGSSEVSMVISGNHGNLLEARCSSETQSSVSSHWRTAVGKMLIKFVIILASDVQFYCESANEVHRRRSTWSLTPYNLPCCDRSLWQVILSQQEPQHTANIRRLHFGVPFLEPSDLKQAHWITLLRFAKTTKRFQ